MDQVMLYYHLSFGYDITFLRVLGMSKILRVIKAFRFMAELRIMATCVLGSMVSLFWSCMFLLFILLVTSFYLVQSTTHYRIDNPACPEAEICEELRNKFGRVSAAMFTLFGSVTGGEDWGPVYKLVALGG